MNDLAWTTTARLEQIFAHQVATTPDAPAIFFRGQVVSYGELDALAEALSRDLSAHGVAPGVIVAVSLRRTPALVAVLLAILKAGGAYLPLDPRYPPKRTAFVLSDSGAALLLSDAASPAFEDFGGNVLELSGHRLIQRAYRSPPIASGPEALAYMLYTSGSTGAPKGVMLGHGATHLVDWARRAHSAEELSRVAATTSLGFDPSIFEIFVPLCTGGALILKADALEPFAADERPTLLDTVPSVLAQLCRADAIPHSVRVLNVGGEALKAELAREVYRRRPAVTLYNHYGPTEATTCVTVARVARDLVRDPPIGRPVRGAEIVLLDDAGRPVEDGQTGEIHIGGPGLALGYLNRPDLTAARFTYGPGGRLYRTGDRSFWRQGELHFAGRVDQQVKVRGFRIELGEIESALMRIPKVERALVAVRENAGRSQLLGYVQSPRPMAGETVREALASWLPDYMLPARIIVLQAFPTLASGKVDHGALPAPEERPGAPAVGASRIEKPIIHVFEEVLARTSVGPDDSFFDLGGDSLASVQAALRLGELLGYELPAAIIHQAPTPRALARSIKHGRVRMDGHVGLLQPGPEAPPLFCMADLFGQPFNYLSLARRLGADRAIYGVAPGPMQSAFARNGDLAALTQSFSSEISRIQPNGPILIAGYSAGGVLAHELACALEGEGRAVQLILLDSYLQSRRPSPRGMVQWALARHRLGAGRRFTAPRFAGAQFVKLMRGMVPAAPPDWIPGPQIAFAARMAKVGAAYQPGRFCGPTLLVRAAQRALIDRMIDDDGLLGWSNALAGEVAQTCVPGGHWEFMREPLAAHTAQAARRFLLAHS